MDQSLQLVRSERPLPLAVHNDEPLTRVARLSGFGHRHSRFGSCVGQQALARRFILLPIPAECNDGCRNPSHARPSPTG